MVVFDAMMSGLPTHKENFAGYDFEFFYDVPQHLLLPSLFNETLPLGSDILGCYLIIRFHFRRSQSTLNWGNSMTT